MRRLSRLGALLVAAVGGVVLLGWIFHIPVLTSVVPGLATMKVNTACAFLAAGVALWSLDTPASWSRSLARVLSLMVAALGVLTLAQDLFAIELGIDAFILGDVSPAADALHPGRMSPTTALNFVCVGLALLSLTVRQSRPVLARGYWLAVVPLFVSAIAIVGYAYDVRSLYQVGVYASMAAHTALCFFVLSLCLLTANPARGIAKIVVSDTAGGVVARLLLPTLPVIIFGLGWLRLAGETAGLYDPTFGLALIVVLSITVCVVGVGITAFRLHNVDVIRKSAEAEFLALSLATAVAQEAEKVVEQARQDQMRFKDEFLSHVSHELRSPLTAIKQFTTILLGGIAGDLNTAQRQYQEIVLKNIQQLQAMIDDLLEVTRLETGKLTVDPESVSIADAVTDTLNTLQGTARAKGVALSSDLSPDLPRALADPTRLRQILIILFDNAIKFTPNGGAVTIAARLSPQDSQFLLVDVSDTGSGISPEIAARVFERLYQASDPSQASRKGLGLGLYICKELVTRQGGEIWVARGAEPGATIAFTLPVFPLIRAPAPVLELASSLA